MKRLEGTDVGKGARRGSTLPWRHEAPLKLFSLRRLSFILENTPGIFPTGSLPSFMPERWWALYWLSATRTWWDPRMLNTPKYRCPPGDPHCCQITFRFQKRVVSATEMFLPVNHSRGNFTSSWNPGTVYSETRVGVCLQNSPLGRTKKSQFTVFQLPCLVTRSGQTLHTSELKLAVSANLLLKYIFSAFFKVIWFEFHRLP